MSQTRRSMLRGPHAAAWGVAALLAITAAAYWPGLRGGYVFDDIPNLLDNTALHVGFASGWSQWLAAIFSSPSSDLQRPLAMLSFALNHALAGLDPYWMKLANLGIHLLNTALVFVLVRGVLRALPRDPRQPEAEATTWPALWATAAWALHPIHVMAVLFVVQRMESLSHTFVFAGLCLYLSGRRQLIADGRGWARVLAGLLGGTLLGTLAKESAVLLPVYALLLEALLLHFRSHDRPRDARLGWLFAATVAAPALAGGAWLLPRVLDPGAYAGRGFTLAERLLTEARVLVDYVHWTVLPNLGQLSLYHDDYPVSSGWLSPPSTLLAVALLAAMAAAAIALRTRRPLTALGLGWFLAAHLLTGTVIPLELVFEHRNYFAALGLCLVLLDIGRMALRREGLRRIVPLLGGGLLVLFAGTTTLRAREWSDQLRFSVTEAEKHPRSPRATYDLARNLVILSDYRADSPYLPHAWTAIERARAAPGANPLPDATAILLAARTGRAIDGAWWRSLQAKLRTQPPGPQQRSALASLVACELRHACRLPRRAMVASFEAALQKSRDPDVLHIYGNYALNVLQDPDLALRLWQEAAQRAPRVAEYQVTLAKLMIASGQTEAAARHIARIRALGPLGQNEAAARRLETALDAARGAPPPR